MLNCSSVAPGFLPCGGFDAENEGCFVCEPEASYHPRNPGDNPLYGVFAGHLEAFLDRQREQDRPVPRFVERELRSFLECGVLANGYTNQLIGKWTFIEPNNIGLHKTEPIALSARDAALRTAAGVG